jgi:hypothetical protein
LDSDGKRERSTDQPGPAEEGVAIKSEQRKTSDAWRRAEEMEAAWNKKLIRWGGLPTAITSNNL